jgi:hypothetical protein
MLSRPATFPALAVSVTRPVIAAVCVRTDLIVALKLASRSERRDVDEEDAETQLWRLVPC